MRDPADVELPALTDGVIELRVLARHSFGDPMCPPGYQFAIGSARTAERVGAVYVDTREIPEHSDMRALGLRRVRRYRWEP